MIRPLRRRHRWLIPGFLLLVAIGALLARSYPAPSSTVDRLPEVIVHADERTRAR